MTEEQLRQIAAQLRSPHGESGVEVAERMNVNNGLMNRWAIEQLAVQPNDRILEVGPGNGRFVPEIVGQHSSVTYIGYDHSELMVSEAKQYNSALVESGRVRFVLRNGPTMPFADGTFTKAFAVNVIYFWEDLAAELAQLHRVLAPSGKLLLVIRPKSIMENLPFVHHGFQLFEPAAVVRMLEANRFRTVDTIVRLEPAQQVNDSMLPLSTVLITGERV
jgi:SAM-dependent methyltransferase